MNVNRSRSVFTKVSQTRITSPSAYNNKKCTRKYIRQLQNWTTIENNDLFKTFTLSLSILSITFANLSIVIWKRGLYLNLLRSSRWICIKYTSQNQIKIFLTEAVHETTSRHLSSPAWRRNHSPASAPASSQIFFCVSSSSSSESWRFTRYPLNASTLK